jgi:hypothetical protein
VADSERGRVADLRRLQFGRRRALDAEHREVGRRIAPDEPRRRLRPRRQRDGNLLVTLDGVIRRDDDPFAPDDAARRHARPRVDGDDRGADFLDRRGQAV